MTLKKRFLWRQVLPALLGGAALSGLLISCAPRSMAPVPSSPARQITAGRPLAEIPPYLVGKAPKRTTTGSRPGLALTGFVLPNFIGSSRCAVCHTKLADQQGNDLSIANHWRSTMMANAAKDPFWQAKVMSEASRHPALRGAIEQKCATCHMPMAWIQQRALPARYRAGTGPGLVEEFLNPGAQLHQAAMDGVSCSLCHQIQDQGLGDHQSFSGNFVIDTATPPPGRKIFGPYRDPLPGTMQSSVGFTPVFGPQTNDSALCATCHTLYTPYVDSRGKVAGKFPEQTIYLEWLHSAYAQQKGRRHEIGDKVDGVRLCQDCHMPHSTAGKVTIAKWAPPETTPRDHLSRHYFVGGNALMINMLTDNIVSRKITASTARLADTRARTVRQLQTATAGISFLKTSRHGDTITALLEVTNLVGHKYPSGFPSRRSWIHFRVTDHSGAVVFESGRPLANGAVAGDNADSGQGFEPHYDLISRPDQVQIYESVMRNTDGKVTFTLLRGAGYIKDNRLLPPGFDKQSAGPDIGVYGRAAADPDFIGGADRITYQINTGGRQGPFVIQAELCYTPISHAFMADLKQDLALPLVRRFARYYDQADKSPVLVAAADKTL